MILKKSKLWRAEVCGAAVSALLAAASLEAQAAGPGQAVGPNIRINAPHAPGDRPGRVGEAIVSDRTGKRLLAGWETMQGTCGAPLGGACTPPKTPGISAYGYSTDGGKTWIDGGPPYLGDNVMTSGRPWLDRGGRDGETFYFLSRATDPRPVEKTDTPGGSGQIGIVLYRGRFQKDGTFTWTDQHLFKPTKPLDLLRSPSLVAAKDGSGKVYVAISPLLGICERRGSSGGQIDFWRSADEGKTWEGPVVVSPDDFLVTPDPKDPLCGSRGTIQLSPDLALGAKGEIYLTWQYGPRLEGLNPFKLTHTGAVRFAKSLDGGRTFTAPKEIVAINSMRENPPVGYTKTTVNDYPRLAVAPGGPHRGRLYVAYTSAVTEATGPEDQQVLTSSQVYLIHSDNQGETWSKPVPLAPPVPPAGVKRLWPAVAVRDNGTVDVVYMESLEKQVTPDPEDVECKIKAVLGWTRTGKASSLSDIYWVQSTDGGATFGAPVRVTTETTNWCKVAFEFETSQFANFGDILGIYTNGTRTFAIWPDGRSGVPDAYFAELGVAGAKEKKGTGGK